MGGAGEGRLATGAGEGEPRDYRSPWEPGLRTLRAAESSELALAVS